MAPFAAIYESLLFGFSVFALSFYTLSSMALIAVAAIALCINTAEFFGLVIAEPKEWWWGEMILVVAPLAHLAVSLLLRWPGYHWLELPLWECVLRSLFSFLAVGAAWKVVMVVLNWLLRDDGLARRNERDRYGRGGFAAEGFEAGRRFVARGLVRDFEEGNYEEDGSEEGDFEAGSEAHDEDGEEAEPPPYSPGNGREERMTAFYNMRLQDAIRRRGPEIRERIRNDLRRLEDEGRD